MTGTPTDFKSLVAGIIDFINLLIPLLFAAVFVFLMWKIIDAWIINVGDENKRSEGKMYIVAAVVAFVIMLSAWGIVALLRNAVFG